MAYGPSVTPVAKLIDSRERPDYIGLKWPSEPLDRMLREQLLQFHFGLAILFQIQERTQFPDD